jgi:hypothetical protein
MFKRLFGKKEEKSNAPKPAAVVAPAPKPAAVAAPASNPAPRNYSKNFPMPPTYLPIAMPMPPTTDPKLYGFINSLQLYGNEFPEKTRKLLLQFFESRIRLRMSTLFSIEYAIQQALNRSIVDKEVIFTLMRPGTRKLEDVLSPYLRPGIPVDKDVYATVYKLLIDQHLAEKTKQVYGTKGGRRISRRRKVSKHKLKTKKTLRRKL